MSPFQRVCDDCARRSWLVGRLAPNLERRRGVRSAVREVLALDDRVLISALAGKEGPQVLRSWRALDPAALLAQWALAGTGAVCRHADGYPGQLLDLEDAPAVLHLYGDSRRLGALLGPGERMVAVVGARRASVEGRETAAAIGRGLAAAGVTVVSGMALGVDSAAHDGALAGGGRTVGVLACGPAHAYPSRRAPLHAALAARGLVLSELPPGVLPWRWAFPARNRIIAGLAEMTIVVEAAERSGSLITAELAAELGREVGAVPGAPSAWRSVGANQLLLDGAAFVRHAADVLDVVLGAGRAQAGAPPPVPAPPDLEPRLAALLREVETTGGEVAELARTPEEARAVLSGLTELELLGLLERTGAGRYARARA